MTSIRHSDTPALERRRERVVNELRLIDAELERRADKSRAEWRAIQTPVPIGPVEAPPSIFRSLGLI